MNRPERSIWLLLVAAVAVTGCSDDDDFNGAPPPSETVLSAVIDTNVAPAIEFALGVVAAASAKSAVGSEKGGCQDVSADVCTTGTAELCPVDATTSTVNLASCDFGEGDAWTGSFTFTETSSGATISNIDVSANGIALSGGFTATLTSPDCAVVNFEDYVAASDATTTVAGSLNQCTTSDYPGESSIVVSYTGPNGMFLLTFVFDGTAVIDLIVNDTVNSVIINCQLDLDFQQGAGVTCSTS